MRISNAAPASWRSNRCPLIFDRIVDGTQIRPHTIATVRPVGRVVFAALHHHSSVRQHRRSEIKRSVARGQRRNPRPRAVYIVAELIRRQLIPLRSASLMQDHGAVGQQQRIAQSEGIVWLVDQRNPRLGVRQCGDEKQNQGDRNDAQFHSSLPRFSELDCS